ncbi:Cation/H(+) antiporter 15 Protein CATION/H+ EXCHANGER 15 [Vigna angularis]|uniref:Cation/H(+) antiporter 15 Protein CATION/H+ EXCHANGER 15 n=2 Tax=Phaseolus angularis TaxID=3914 RepID=A0A8T0KM66_PHAAN|nr:Cation/H(+) antiporter 15 Protein CATION/H+ EXCHANGER 15 [Vigna angularis]
MEINMRKMEEATNKSDDYIVCYAPTMITTNGVWQGDNPLDYSLPLFILQLTLVVIATRLFVFILKPFRQPRVIAEVLGGVVLGPSVLGQNETFANAVFPLRSVMVIETMANIGLLYFLFLVGVEMDITVMRSVGRKAVASAMAGMILPFLVGVAFSYLLAKKTDTHINQGTYILFLGVALSVTAFPVLARILAELKLVNTELGKLALSAALINDVCAWVLLALAIALAENNAASLASLWVLLSGAAFVAFCVFAVRPAVEWLIRKTPEGETFSEFYISLILAGVMVSGFITDAIGTHSVFGAFVFGLVIPNGPLSFTLVEKLEDFVSGLLLPLFFAISGLKTNLALINGSYTWAILILVIFLACIGKVLGTLLIALLYQMPIREGAALGLLMNTKGLVEMVVLNVGKDQKVFDEESFAVMVVITVIMTAIIVPAISIIYRPSRSSIYYKRRTIEISKSNTEFRLLVCIHTPRNVPTMINLLEASNPSKNSPICAYVLHLVELSGRTSAMLIVHNTAKQDLPALNRTEAQSDHIIKAFENYEQHASFIAVQPLTAISPYSTMHEDICNLAADKRVALIIVPFHKQQTVDGGMEATNMAYRAINQNVLANAPCSVGILVDRGLSGSNRLAGNQVSHHIAVLFFGGPDDREALCYGWRMMEHPGISLTIMRFLPGEQAEPSCPQQDSNNMDGPRMLTVQTDRDIQKKLDEKLLEEFRMSCGSEDAVDYVEKVVNNGEDTVAAIRSMDDVHDLFVVGRGQGMISPLTAGLTDWSECPEMGAIGDLLASSDFAATASVLVVQQYVGQVYPGTETPNGDDYIDFSHCSTSPAAKVYS